MQNILKKAVFRLEHMLPLDEAWYEAEVLLGHVLSRDRSWIKSHPEASISLWQRLRYARLIRQRLQHKPIAYLIHKALFCGMPFFVNTHVLIPRPETEELVNHVIQHLREHPSQTLWDVGTGSGCISLSVAQVIDIPLLQTDVSVRALRVAKRNAKTLVPHASITRLRANLMDDTVRIWLKNHAPDSVCIVANLPYLPLTDKDILAKDVVAFEPMSALFTKDQGMALNKKLMQQISAWYADTKTTFTAFFEIDPPQAEVLLTFAQKQFSNANVVLLYDPCDRARWICVKHSG